MPHSKNDQRFNSLKEKISCKLGDSDGQYSVQSRGIAKVAWASSWIFRSMIKVALPKWQYSDRNLTA